MTPSHYDLYEEMTRATRSPINDTPPDDLLEPMLDQALRLGADSPNFEAKENTMTNSIQAENREWQANLNEHVTYLPPYVTAEYSTPVDAEGVNAPIRIRPANDSSMYAFEVSAPDHHQLSLDVVPVQHAGQTLGHSVLAIDAAWEHEQTPGDLEDASSVKVYELAQFDDKDQAESYSMELAEYMDQRDINPSGTSINEAIDFVKGVAVA